MISRYSLPDMKKIWSDENKFNTWLKVELLACEALCELGEIPKAFQNSSPTFLLALSLCNNRAKKLSR